MNIMNVSLFCLMFIGMVSIKSSAQPSEAVAKEKMKAFAFWAGHWQGEGSIQMGPGEPKKSKVDEHIDFKLNGTVLLIEGVGKSVPGDAIVHHALGIVSFDQSDNQYKLNSYLKDGRNAAAWLKIIEDNKYQWGFDTPQGKIKYSITIDPAQKTWNEIGEFSSDAGTTWFKFFEMNLIKI